MTNENMKKIDMTQFGDKEPKVNFEFMDVLTAHNELRTLKELNENPAILVLHIDNDNISYIVLDEPTARIFKENLDVIVDGYDGKHEYDDFDFIETIKTRPLTGALALVLTMLTFYVVYFLLTSL